MSESKKQYRARMRREHGKNWHKKAGLTGARGKGGLAGWPANIGPWERFDDDPESVGRDVYGAEVVYDWDATADTAHVYREKGGVYRKKGYRVEISPEAGYDYEGADIVSRAARSQDVVHILDEYRRTHRKGNPFRRRYRRR